MVKITVTEINRETGNRRSNSVTATRDEANAYRARFPAVKETLRSVIVRTYREMLRGKPATPGRGRPL